MESVEIAAAPCKVQILARKDKHNKYFHVERFDTINDGEWISFCIHGYSVDGVGNRFFYRKIRIQRMNKIISSLGRGG